MKSTRKRILAVLLLVLLLCSMVLPTLADGLTRRAKRNPLLTRKPAIVIVKVENPTSSIAPMSRIVTTVKTKP